ncbi:hypothetical protein F5Y05DRAFT_408913 [Hypoxylon sp. FL0543]|nr:hypothetical protein F5Y05DRAFT_408913 [Hypoxylon sp. FL0543]
MDSIMSWLNPRRKERKKRDAENTKHPPLERLTHKQGHTNGTHRHIEDAKMDFTPRTQGQQATLAFMNSGRLDDLTHLLDERDRAERQVYRGPRTRGNKEVQLILREPSVKSLQKLYRVCKQAELSVKYGAGGEFVYNFSKSYGWNKTNAPEASSLQLGDFSFAKRERRGLSCNTPRIPRVPFSPIEWLDLRPSGVLVSDSLSLSPISEPGGWRDLPRPQTFEQPRVYSRGSSPVPLDVDVREDKCEVGQAKVLRMRKIPIWKVRRILVKSPRLRAKPLRRRRGQQLR